MQPHSDDLTPGMFLRSPNASSLGDDRHGSCRVESTDRHQLAHELANLLDGGLRRLSLTLRQLRQSAESEPSEADATPGGSADLQLVEQLEVVNDAMQQMAALVRSWSEPARPIGRLLPGSRTVEATVRHAVALLAPAAEMAGVRMEIDLDDCLAGRPGGPIYPVIANAVRNSIEAISRHRQDDPSRRDGWIVVRGRHEAGRAVLIIEDNGPGFHPSLIEASGGFRFGETTKAGGHGIGLGLCLDIAHSLGGGLQLSNREPHGACVKLEYPDGGEVFDGSDG